MVHAREVMREMAERGAVSHDLGNGELPSREGDETGNDEHACHDDAGRFTEHGRICKAEGRK